MKTILLSTCRTDETHQLFTSISLCFEAHLSGNINLFYTLYCHCAAGTLRQIGKSRSIQVNPTLSLAPQKVLHLGVKKAYF